MLQLGIILCILHLGLAARDRAAAQVLFPYGPIPGMLFLFALPVVLGLVADRITTVLTARGSFMFVAGLIVLAVYFPTRYFIFELGDRAAAHRSFSLAELGLAAFLALVLGAAFGSAMWRRHFHDSPNDLKY